jgi:hypothetical protein
MSRGPNKQYNGALRHADSDPPVPQPQLQSTQVGPQVTGERRRTARRGYKSRAVPCRAVLRQLAVAGRCGYVVCIQTEGYRGTGRPWATAARMTRRVDVADWRTFGTFGGLGVMVRFSALRREVEDGQLVQEAFDPHSAEGFSHAD